MILLVSASSVRAQDYGYVEDTSTNVSSFYYHVQPGVETIQVQVLGTVLSPGLYVVSAGTDLGVLLALAGGPVLGPRGRDSRREVAMQLFRPESGEHTLSYEAALERAMPHPELHTVLTDGDILNVEVIERTRFSWRDGLTLVGVAASLTLAIERLSRVQ
jgi:hypothetical protein